MKHVIFLHPNCSTSEIFEKVSKSIKPQYCPYAFNFEGHGEANYQQTYSYFRLKKQALETINQLEGEKLVVGNSLGGLVALDIAPQIANLKGLVLMGIAPLKKPINFAEVFLPFPAQAHLMAAEPDMEMVKETIKMLVNAPEHVEFLNKAFQQVDPNYRTAIGADLGNPDNFPDQVQRFMELDAKKYVWHGAQDPIISQQYWEKLQTEYPDSFELTILDNCGHYPTLDQADKCAEMLQKACEACF